MSLSWLTSLATPVEARPSCSQVCPAGSFCLADGRCAPNAAPLSRAEQRAQRLAERERRRNEAIELRLYERRRLRLQLGMRFGIARFPDDEGGGVRTFGIEPALRGNFAKHLGILLGSELYAGAWENRFVNQGAAWGVRVHATPFVGPFARFYLGPTVLAGAASYTIQRSHRFRYAEGLTDELWVSGWGVRAGWFFGAREQIDLRLSILSLIEADEFRISGFDSREFQLGLGFAF